MTAYCFYPSSLLLLLLQEGTLLVLELCEGDLTKLTRQGPLSPESAIPVAQTIANTLNDLDREGILHLDLKQENVLLKNAPEEGVFLGRAESWTEAVCKEIRVCDFGLAKLQSADGSFIGVGKGGTPLYMAPEQWKGAMPTAKTDVYALGVLLWELLSGKRAWEGTGLPEGRDDRRIVLRQRVLDGQRPSLEDIPTALRPLVSCMWRQDEAGRPTAEECSQFLDCPLNIFLQPSTDTLIRQVHMKNLVNVKALLKLGLVDFNGYGDGLLMGNPLGKEKWTAAHQASHDGDAKILRILVDANADLSAQDPRYQNTPAHLAAQQGHVEVLKILGRAGVDMEARNRFGQTPAGLATWNSDAFKALEELKRDNMEDPVVNDTNRSVRACGGFSSVSVSDSESHRVAEGGDEDRSRSSRRADEPTDCMGSDDVEGAARPGEALRLTREERETLAFVSGLEISESSFLGEGNVGPIFKATLHGQAVVIERVVDEGDKFQQASAMLSVMRRGASHPNIRKSFGESFCKHPPVALLSAGTAKSSPRSGAM
uniref:Protein kinase domain-containing protein n=1 Tax=Chromera velia CCMP2878 TaxID=1169474 RepID=A0A0G4G686_9ALVE|eukprot:Cvel_20466.t1-p1 / transcript=Cvel_20466.t1 / gene=Cvel_20466 / organism=Chromera_velia_CCMP2878 / gene_product=Serine/threonine-protein kinase PkaA, putative / transcript_product=Serine/threonine-protein kinase PkaA, putative / location=Cvel_scaffold1838:22564-26148(-) / protein_length=541 / sequence_SO=supercontig / SO=protein_coding / is_pseudo=false